MEKDGVSPHTKMVTICNYLRAYFNQNQGVRLGETAVVSRKVHEKKSRRSREIKIVIDRDAGQTYWQYFEPNQVVHIDVYHQPGQVDPRRAASVVLEAVHHYFQDRDALLPGQMEPAREVNLLLEKITLGTTLGEGSIARLVKYREIKEGNPSRSDHVHILAELREEDYGLIYYLVEAVEEAIQAQGLEIRKILGVTHGFGQGPREKLGAGIVLALPAHCEGVDRDMVYEQNQRQLLINLASRLGSLEEVEEFLQALNSNLFKKASTQSFLSKKHGDLTEVMEQLKELGVVKKSWFGYSLTPLGKELNTYLVNHERELEGQLRKLIRRTPVSSRYYTRFGYSQLKARKQELTDESRIISFDEQGWLGDIAVPETIISAVKRSRMEGRPRIRVKTEDIKVYGRKSYTPVDICLLIDCSSSMAGEKSKAAWFLAEHLLLSSREKLAVVTFQEMEARVTVPFTRNHRRLVSGLHAVFPEGLTPLASGLVKCIELIKNSRVRNPLLILITDGLPTYPLWTFDAQKDALDAARMVAMAKIRFACIGVQSSKDFLKDLAREAAGTLYVVDKLDRESLIAAVRDEWFSY